MWLRRTAALSLLAIIFSPGSARAQQTPATRATDADATRPSDNERITALLAQLSLPDPKQRSAAQENLIRFGPAASAQVQQFRQRTTDPEAQTRAAVVLSRITDEQLLGSTIISLSARARRPRDIFADIAKQANITFWPNQKDLWPDDAALITVDLDHVPFWQAVLSVGAQCDIEPATSRRVNPLEEAIRSVHTIDTAPNAVALRRVDDGKPAPTSFHGPFLIVASSSFTPRSPEAVANHGPPEGAVWLKLISEPKLKPLTWQALDTDIIIDAEQQPCTLTHTPSLRCVWGRITTMEYQFTTAAKPANRLSRFKGRTQVTLATELAHLDDQQVLKGKPITWQAGHIRFEIAGAKKSADGAWSFDAKVVIEPGAPDWVNNNEYLQDLLVEIRPRLLDDHDRPLAYTGGSVSREQPHGEPPAPYQFSASFRCEQNIPEVGPLPTAPVKLTWEFPTEIITRQVPFDLHDLRLSD